MLILIAMIHLIEIYIQLSHGKYQLANDFYNNAIPYLRILGEKYGKDNVRIVYFFDN